MLNFFRNGLKTLKTIEPFIRNVVEKHHTDYQLIGLPNRVSVDGEPMRDYESTNDTSATFNGALFPGRKAVDALIKDSSMLDVDISGTIMVIIGLMWDVNVITWRYLSTDFVVSDSKSLMEPPPYIRLLLAMSAFSDSLSNWLILTSLKLQTTNINGYVTNVGRTTNQKSGSRTLNFYLANQRGQALRVTLWGGLRDVLIEKITKHAGIVVESSKHVVLGDCSQAKEGTLENDQERMDYPSCGGSECKKGAICQLGKLLCEACNKAVEYHVIRNPMIDVDANFPVTITNLIGTTYVLELKSHTYYEYGTFESFTYWKINLMLLVEEGASYSTIKEHANTPAPAFNRLSRIPSVYTPSKGLEENKKKRENFTLQILEKRKGEIAWKMSDIKGIGPSYCTHKFLMEDDFKPPPEDKEKATLTCPYGTFAYRKMSFGLCNAPTTFQRCMTVIFHDMVKDFMEVFMDDFVVFGHKIYEAGIEVDRAKIDVIAKFPYPTNVKELRSFLGHAGFYRRFIKDFSMISKLMTKLLMKDAKFDFSDDCKKAFNILKEKLTTTPIIISPEWNVPFELMCDASDFVVGDVLGQRINGKFKPIYYASKTLNNAQEHYTTTEKELLAVVFSFDKFFPYDEPYAFKLCPDNVMRRCVAGNEILKIMAHCHSGPIGGHHSALITGRKVYESGFFSPEIKHKAYSVLKQCNMDLIATAKNHFMKLHKLMELRDSVYENTRIYKERTKIWHDSRLRGDKNFKIGDKVLLFDSRFKMHLRKLKSKWYGPNVVKTVYPYGTMEITNKNEISFKINGQRLKKYHDGHINVEDKEVVEFEGDTT
nr:DNA-directed DNA polymerase [Tanacetum cinerariifolium]